MFYNIEKSLNDFGDKVTEDDKAKVQPKLDALKEALKGTDIEDIKAKKEELQKAFYEVAEKVYKENGGNPQDFADAANAAGAAPNSDDDNNGDDGAVDVEFTEKK